MLEEVDFDEIAEMMELDSDIELKHQWKHFYDTLHVFGLKVYKQNEGMVTVKQTIVQKNVKGW